MNLTSLTGALCAVSMALGAATEVQAASLTRSVQFAKGSSSATIQGSVKGYDTMNYTLRAGAGQTMTVSMKTSHEGAYFNVLPPGSKDVAIYNSSINGNAYSGTLAKAGTYTVRVYLMRNEARRGVKADYTLNLAITGAIDSVDAKVPGTKFHATGQVACTMGSEPAKTCPFGVIRSGPGHAEVHITPPGGLARKLKFSGNRATAPGSQSIKADKQGDEWTIQVNDFERYRIPDAVINGG